MNLGNKIREYRKNMGWTQEQLAEKLCVSRQAITKWENHQGTPSIDSLQDIAELFAISIDDLLHDENFVSAHSSREQIDISSYSKEGRLHSLYDSVVLDKFPNAVCITALMRRKKFSLVENIVDFIIQPGSFQIADSLSDLASYYLVESTNSQQLVKVTKEFIESKQLHSDCTKRKITIGNMLFTKIRILKNKNVE